MTEPSAANMEPWQGQSHVRSALFQVTVQPLCVHLAERRWRLPPSSLQAAIFSLPLMMMPPWPGLISSTLPTIDCVSPFL